MTDLPARLRDYAAYRRWQPWHHDLLAVAATEVERLTVTLRAAEQRADAAEARCAALTSALLMAVARDTGDPDHDWQTCAEPSCVSAREALAWAK